MAEAEAAWIMIILIIMINMIEASAIDAGRAQASDECGIPKDPALLL